MQPPSPGSLVIEVPDAPAMQRLGERLGRALAAGDVIALIGPLGAGKTTFAQGVAAGAGVPPSRHVASPTFALVNEHPGRVGFVHADFYRVQRVDELRELGLEEAFDRAAAAVEWADRFPEVLPSDRLEITIESLGAARRLAARGTGPRGRALCDSMR